MHNLKMVPKAKLVDRPVQKSRPTHYNIKNRKKKKGLFSRVLDEAWDAIEDVFD
ncbi:hypothetical protein CLV75_2178 [Ruegeria conchae]|uniref:Uncharacterized protein n=1 Tax=Ruegeria conchae TaxID=981384 RepID=A0A497ZIH9_9RHOB|nr:hypothetical protein CLV75_2178 [Ruegeria conchae]